MAARNRFIEGTACVWQSICQLSCINKVLSVLIDMQHGQHCPPARMYALVHGQHACNVQTGMRLLFSSACAAVDKLSYQGIRACGESAPR